MLSFPLHLYFFFISFIFLSPSLHFYICIYHDYSAKSWAASEWERKKNLISFFFKHTFLFHKVKLKLYRAIKRKQTFNHSSIWMVEWCVCARAPCKKGINGKQLSLDRTNNELCGFLLVCRFLLIFSTFKSKRSFGKLLY